jgi:trigger factor
LRDKTLAGKNAVFDVKVLEASKRTLPELTDEFAEKVRSGLTVESLKEELTKAIDSEDSREFAPARNAALSKALAEIIEVDVPDTLVTNQAREKYAMMMSDMRNNGVDDDAIKKQITPENFIKYKNVVRAGIVRDFKVSMATDEIGRMEAIEVPEYQVQEQMEQLKEKMEQGEEIDEKQMRDRIEATIQRELVMDFLAENANLEVVFTDGEQFDESLLEQLAEETMQREETEPAAEPAGESAPAVVSQEEIVEVEVEVESEPEPEPVAATSAAAPVERDYASMSVEDKAYYALMDAGALDTKED